MAAKKIGAVIALDNEKEFRDAATNCNKSLATLKSEMALVKAQSEGQANSLESLKKKHEVLNKVLEEQKNKQDATRKGLEHAQEAYDKVGKGIQTLTQEQEKQIKKVDAVKEAYENATQKLEEMNDSGDASKKELKEQETVVKSLSEELKKEESALKEVNAALNKGEKNYQVAGNRIQDWEAKLNTAEAQVIKATAEVNKNAQYMKEAAQSTDLCAKSIDEYGKEVKKAESITIDFATVVKTNLSNTIVNTVKSAVSDAVSSVTDLEGAQRQLQVSTGATSAEMRKYKAVMQDLHDNNYGNDISDVADSMALVKRYIKDIDPSNLEKVTENGIAMRDVFDMDLSETIRGVDALMTHMGLDAQEAFDLMAKGAQNGLDKSGELADNIAEYSQLWSQAGFSASEMFTILDNGLESGAYNLDKVNDFVKEFTISLADGRIEDNLDKFSAKTQELFGGWQSGGVTAKEVFYSVIDDLAKATNQQEALTIASNTWSALGEDNAMAVITSLNEVNTTYDNVKGTMESIKDIKYDTLESRIQQLGKKFQTEVGTPIVEEILPGMEQGLDFVIENMDELMSLAAGAGAAFATYKVATATIGVLTTATEGATVATTLLNAVSKANPFVLLSTAVVGAGTALLSFATNAGEASAEVEMLVDENYRVVDSANAVADSLDDSMLSYRESKNEMRAQSEYAKNLADRIEVLASKSNLSSAEISVMSEYIAELNNLVPELNLAYDEQAQKLSISTDEINKNIQANQKQIEQQTAQEYANELLKKRSELEIEGIKLKNELNDVTNRRNELLDDENVLAYQSFESLSALILGVSDERKEYQNLTEAQEENQEAITANEAAKASLLEEEEKLKAALEKMGLSWDAVTGAVTAVTDAETQAAETQTQVVSAMSENANMIAETYTTLKDSVSGALESQMRMFEEFDKGTELSTTKLLANMQSQIDGVTNWADNISLLADRGINQNLLQYLAEMGPEGAGYVATFASMSDDELKKANEMWTKSMDMKSGVESNINGMLESVTTSLSGGKEKVAAAFQEVGVYSVTGLTDKLLAGKPDAENAGKEVGESAVGGCETGAGTHSPSWKTAEIGKNMNQGLINGINQTKGNVSSTMKNMMNDIIKNVSTGLDSGKFVKDGKSVATGITQGVNAGRSGVISSISDMTAQVKSRVAQDLVISNYIDKGRAVSGGVAKGIDSGRGEAIMEARVMASDVYNNASNIGSLYYAGLNVSYGLADGISAGRSSVINAVANVCQAAINQAYAKLQIHSPSKVFEKIGSFTAEGFGVGYEKKIANVRNMVNDSMNYDVGARSNGYRESRDVQGTNAGKLVVELPIYTGNTYTRTEIVEIALDGIGRAQNRYKVAKGVMANV